MRILLRVREVSERLACSQRHVRDLFDRRELTGVRDGRFIRVYADSLDAYIRRYATGTTGQRQEGTPEAPRILAGSTAASV
ncbi:MAG: excisionase family DNA-binding protein [Gemmataceae bacterium]|nr:excisionase family DNA-binding protein [Gemmataceae bacterium]